jgi:outer membrane lipoprotein carrier protein
MRTKTVILLLSLFTLTLSAQKDPEALQVLSDFSRKATQAPSVTMDFRLTTSDSKSGDVTTMSGSAIISGDRYRLKLDDYNIWTDGSNVWNYSPDVNEVTVTETDPDDDSFITRPSLLFTMYEEGYKIRLIEQTSDEWVIDLYPEAITSDLIRIRLKIGKTRYDLNGAEYKTKDGVTMTLIADKYDLTFKPSSDFFTFNPADYKGVDVIDMR